MTLLSIVTDVCQEVGLPTPATIYGNTGTTALKFLGLADREGKELARRTAWQAITKEKTFTSIAAEEQTSVIPSDFDRMVNGSFFNRTQSRRVLGPLTAREWQVRKATTSSVVTDHYRIRGDAMLLMPTPTAGETYAYEYVSKNWLTDSTGVTERAAWGADDDVALLEENLITLGVKWRWLKSMGLDYSEEFRTYELQVKNAMTRDGSKRTISMAGDRDWSVPRAPGVAEGSWNL